MVRQAYTMIRPKIAVTKIGRFFKRTWQQNSFPKLSIYLATFWAILKHGTFEV